MKVVCGAAAFVLGPWVGLQILGYQLQLQHSSVKSQDDSTSNASTMSAIIFSSIVYTLSIIMLAMPKRLAPVGLWIVGSVVSLAGHWTVFWVSEKFRTGPAAGNEHLPVQATFTVVYGILLFPPINSAVYNSFCGGDAFER